MSDQFPGTISIGGFIPRALIPELLEVIQGEGVAYDYGESPPQTEEDLEEIARDPNNHGYLVLKNSEARYGYFRVLEEFLISHHIPFHRHSDGYGEHDAEIEEYRPERGGPYYFHSRQTDGSTPLVDSESILKLIAPLKAFMENPGQAGAMLPLQVADLIKGLEECCGVDIPPLPPFQIYSDGSLEEEEDNGSLR